MRLFRFNPAKKLFIGVECEAFITNNKREIIPRAQCVLERMHIHDRGPWSEPDICIDPRKTFGYELSACQIESRIGPCILEKLEEKLNHSNSILEFSLNLFDLKPSYIEVGPEDMPLDVYPDPSGRYQEIVKTMPHEVLLAACRVIGTHVHVGMPDHETALRVYNHVIKRCDWLCSKGNGSFGERLDIYRIVAPDCDPLPYNNWTDFHRVACDKGFDKDPRKCWTLIRMSKHGTIEFRMFGATSSIKRIVSWAQLCHDLCAEAMI